MPPDDPWDVVALIPNISDFFLSFSFVAIFLPSGQSKINNREEGEKFLNAFRLCYSARRQEFENSANDAAFFALAEFFPRVPTTAHKLLQRLRTLCE
jgi:hypothetical protein